MAVAAQFAYTFPERCERLVLVGTGGVARSVSLLLRLAAAPNADLLMPTFGSPIFKFGSRVAAQVLRVLGTDLGRDTEEILKVFDSLPTPQPEGLSSARFVQASTGGVR